MKLEFTESEEFLSRDFPISDPEIVKINVSHIGSLSSPLLLACLWDGSDLGSLENAVEDSLLLLKSQ